MNEADPSLERIRRICIIECEHHGGAEEESPEAVEVTGLCAALRMRLNSIIISGTEMLTDIPEIGGLMHVHETSDLRYVGKHLGATDDD